MGRTTVTVLPSLQRRLESLGENIRLARLRRRLTTTQIAERAGIARATLASIENGSPAVSLGAYASVLFCLGLDSDLDFVARDDEFGRKLQDAKMVTPLRARRKARNRFSSLVKQSSERLQEQ